MKKIGIYNPYLDTKGGGEKVCAALAEYFAKDKSNQVFLVSHIDLDINELAEYFALDLSRVHYLQIKDTSIWLKIARRLPVPARARNFWFDHSHLRKLRREKFDLFINNSVFSNMSSPSPNGVYLCMFPQKLALAKDISLAKKIYMTFMNALYRYTMHPGAKYGVSTYRKIVANSEFTKRHIKQRWGLDSTVLYPLCEDMYVSSLSKEKIILNVGRFFEYEKSGAGHHKRQDILLTEFAKLTDLHKDGWQLHFAGSVAEDKGTLKYIIKLTQSAKGLPVYFHFNCAYKELKELFNKAIIYWHATGFGSDPDKHPERQEHFGMSTVEAMSTGAIPVVINTAGQKESVKHGFSGFLWNDTKQLANYTLKVTQAEPKELKKLQTAAKNRAVNFNQAAFNKKVQAIFGEMLR